MGINSNSFYHFTAHGKEIQEMRYFLIPPIFKQLKLYLCNKESCNQHTQRLIYLMLFHLSDKIILL